MTHRSSPVEHTHTNALIRETSPYLLQHAHNPVDWHGWGEGAFALARAQDKSIFLSIGYSTCYWCHVMERESFENEVIAQQLNDQFVCIKVDREERPDVDDIYMAAVQQFTALTEGRASGGWPMSLFLEPHSLKPFYAGTYYPAEESPRYGRPSFPRLCSFLAGVWREKRPEVIAQAHQIAQLVIEQLAATTEPVPVGAAQVRQAVTTLLSINDPIDGGFGGAPKFPQPVFLQLLLGAAWDMDAVRRALLHTLDRMAIGGVYDQIGGGFHRYSVDGQWLVPHFEKMLYDNGQLLSVYAAAYEQTRDLFYARIMRQTAAYVQREMTSADGAFFSAQDAEVETREGGNYLWTADEVREALTRAGLESEVELALHAYGFDNGPNFRDPHHPEDQPANVVHLIDTPPAIAESRGMSVQEFFTRLDRINAALLAVRKTRKQPATDDKILAGWNGLMIGGLADAGRALGDSQLVEAAQCAADFLLRVMRSESGGLLRTLRAGQARIDGFLEDYALLISGLLALDRAMPAGPWLQRAAELADAARARFFDDRGGYFDTLAGQSDLFVRTASRRRLTGY